jgi:predicted transposase/invertase (TIGR01784 family)
MEGFLQGFKEGMEKGKLNTTRKLLSRGMAIEEITDITGLTSEDIASLIN